MKRVRESNDVNPPPKIPKTRESLNTGDEKVCDWQASLGCSLAERLEKIDTVQHLTTRQIKKLLKDVLTNEDVVIALRRYINGEFKEPETGEVSAATRRRAKSLGLFSVLSNLRGELNCPLESRAITRSLMRRFQDSLQNHLPRPVPTEVKQPCTILDIQFPDEDESIEKNVANTLNTSSADSDYQPNDKDYEILRRDRVLDFTEASKSTSSVIDLENETSRNSIKSFSSSSSESDSKVDLDSVDSVHTNNRNSFLSYESDSQDLPTPRFTRSQAKSFSGGLSEARDMFLTEICFDGVESPGSNISFQLNSTVRPSPPDNAFCCADAEGEEEGREMIAAEGADVGNNTIKNNDLNTENDVYAQFLRSLFSSVCNSTNSSPNKSNSRMTASVDTSSICERLLEKNSNDNECLSSIKHQSDSERKSSWLSNWLVQKDGNNDDEDDPDDPEFDVMAELDDIDREDFFYELRDDRAVRVSKMEAKNLHEDLRELFNSEDEHETRSRESKTPSVLTMKAYGQRLFHMDHNSRTRNSNQTEGCNSPHHIQSSVPHAIPPKDIDVPVNPVPARRRITLTGAELVRLERQLAMHIQLLATNFLLTYDFPDMHETATRPCASLLKTLVAKRQAFDLLALQKNITNISHPVTSFYWHCPTLEMAVDLISDYAGLSMLPRLPWNPYKQGVANSLTKSQSFALPIPYCLLRIMINSPIWSYACLMPTVLGPHPKSHVRLIFHPSEDALMIMGLADFSGALIRSRKIIQPKLSHQRRLSRGHGSLNKQPGRYIAYRLIGRHILPYRTLLQLRSRRWNLLANRDSIDNAGNSKNASVATHRLLQLYTELSQPGEVDLKGIQQYANEMTSLAVPYAIPLVTACLTDRNSNDLFTFEGLPTDVGYEHVLNSNYRSENVKRRLDLLTDFVERAECFWRSEIEKSRTKEVTTINSFVNDEFLIKPEQPIECDVLGPSYLPAIPVDLNPDGTIVLSRTSEPALVEVFKVADKPGSIPPLSDLTEGSVNLPNVETKHNQSVVSHHIEFILARVNTQKSRSSSKNGEMVTKNTQSSDISDGIMKSSVPEFTLSEPQFEDLPNILESYWNHTGNVALDACQKVADALVNIFHFGFDKFCVVNGDGCFGPKKFNQLPKSSLSSLNPHSSNSDTNCGWPNQSQSVLDPTVSISEECHSQPAGVFPSTCFLSSSRFVARCRARGDATAADLLTLPSSVISHSQAVIDEMDVRRARSLLDRCRTYLTTSDYKRMMRNLSSLNQAIQNPTSIVGTHDHSDKTEVLVSLSRVLNCLKKHVSLWEDFVCLLTPSQARSLGLLSTYFNLAHIARVQRVLQDIVPRDRRFWRRLRNLADSCNIEVRHIPVKKKIYMDQNDTTLESSNISEQSLNDCNQRISRENHTSRKLSTTEKNSGVILNKNQSKSFRVRGMRLKGGSMHDAFAKTWSVLESSWRNRPVLLSRIASLINTRHKPYAGFEQSFEETDVLARHSVGIPIPSEELSQSISASNADDCIRPLKVKTGSPVSILPPQVLSFLSEGWEVCTELSSTVHSRNNSLGVTWARRQCPCRCHPVSSNKFSITTGQSGKPAKVDSLGLRHCISCSLRVHRGIVYIDACNLHLRHVKITWPPNFKPKARLPSNPSLIDSALNQNHRPTTIHHTPSNIPTRIAVNELVKMHARSYSSNKLSNHCTLLPDMAGRRVSIEYIPALKSTTSSNRKVTDFSNQDEGNASKAVDGIQLPCPPIVPNRNRSSSEPLDLGSISSNVENPAIWTLDDEAACFNTEAFASTSNTNHENEFINNETDDWTSEEDRQLLEFCKARGLYSSRMFKDLARIWEPKPYNYSPQRNSAELEARFKYLMRITLREAYDPELFQTPYREDSPYEDS